jgi:glycosyltransferase involved in cell wall biosynthesis
MSLLLTIAIPTYNRADLLSRQISSILEFNHSDNIEIIVSDNCSSDNTEGVVYDFCKKHSQIKYFKNSSNIGFDKNLYTIYGLASAQYIWFLSDDDLIHENSINYILETIKNNSNTEMFVFSFTHLKSDLIQSCYDSNPNVYKSFKLQAAVSQFFRSIMISTLVLRKRTDINMDYLLSLSNSNYPQVTLCLLLLKKNFDFLVSNSLVILREPGYITTNLFKLYCLDIRSAIRNASLFEGTQALLLSYTDKNLKEFVKIQVLERLDYFISKKGFQYTDFVFALKEFRNSFSNFILLIEIFILSRLPKVLFKSIYFAYFLIKYQSYEKLREKKLLLLNHKNQNIINPNKFSGF